LVFSVFSVFLVFWFSHFYASHRSGHDAEISCLVIKDLVIWPPWLFQWSQWCPAESPAAHWTPLWTTHSDLLP
jgi:hypothetical protein